MTPRANSLTERARRRAASYGSKSTISAHDLRVFVDGLQRLGYDQDRILSTAGVSAPDLAKPDARVTNESVGRVFAAAQSERSTPNLALELARVTPFGAWPLLDYLVLTADTVGAGVYQLVRYFRLTGSPVAVKVREDVEPVQVAVISSSPFAVEYDSALMVFHFRNETEGRFTAAALNFQHAVDDHIAFERALGCAVYSNANWSGISIPRDAWRLPLRRRDPVLRQMLEQHAKELLAKLPSRTGLAAEVQRALTSRVAAGDSRIDGIARQFAMSPRTLQRKLAQEGVSYQGLLDAARKEAAGKYLADSTLAICEIAYLLGYSEPAPFHRAFKRWYRTTPEAFREAKL